MSPRLRQSRLSSASKDGAYEAIRAKRIEEVRALLAEIAVGRAQESGERARNEVRETREGREVCCT
jgi:hypothetical protein